MATNFNFCAIDNTDKTTVHNVYHGTIIQTVFCIIVPFVYIFDAFLNASFRKKADELKYPIYFIQDIWNIIPRPKNEIKFVVLDLTQAPKKGYAGFYAAAFTYFILKGKTILRCTINQALLPDQLINVIEFSIYSRNFSHLGVFDLLPFPVTLPLSISWLWDKFH